MRHMVTQYRLPDTLAKWPYRRRLNPHYLPVKAKASAWLESFNALSPKAQNSFNRCDFNLFAALAYPTFDEDRLRTACDLMNLLFLYDEYSDREGVDGMKRLSAEIMYALRNPHEPRKDGKYIVGEIFRQFWERAIQTGNPNAHRRFVQAFDHHTAAMVEEAHDRSKQRIRNIEGYLKIRRGTIGARPVFRLIEFDMNIPSEVLDHPILLELVAAATDMLSIGNDIYSYNVEQARGDDTQNLVTIVMHEKNIDLPSSLAWIKEFHDSLVSTFLTKSKGIPSFGVAIDAEVAQYVEALGNWVRANDCWCFESQRYFGTKGLQIQKQRLVTLLPKQVA
ncbi:unnamed protein product [Somion occarium]|uniref:Terpene synthase n=2 Tax=Somion occarium TaxID=3059160 RepID=A0ABP1D666_9APHY